MRSQSMRVAAMAVGLTMLVGSTARSEPAQEKTTARQGWRAMSGPRAAPAAVPKAGAVDAAIDRGVEFLLKSQNRDGSWGSVRILRSGDVYAPIPGAHHAFRTAVTALCISALIETGRNDSQVTQALDRGETWLLERLPKLRRATEDTLYNNWGHAYSIQALVRMHRRHEGDAGRQLQIKQAIESQIKMLERYECVDGGWCYYDFEAHTQRPSGSTISFVTATVLIALDEAKGIGVEIPKPLVDRGMASIRRQRKPDFSYCYGEYLKYRPMHPVNQPGGSLGRSQVCNLAMRLWGDASVTEEVLIVWLDRLFARNLWLDIARKEPVPHNSHYAVAAYFFFYGHYYAALCIEQLPAAERSGHQNHLAAVMLRLQEPDGSWWDFPFYDYHKQYGTAFAIMSLQRCRPAGAD